MKFKGNAKSDTSNVFPEDEYFLTCTHVQDKDKEGNPLKSKAGNDMWILEFSVSEGPQKDRKLWHYLVFIPEGLPGHGMPLKCLKAFGIDPEGETDILPEHLLNVTIKAKVKIEQKDDYDPANRIAKFFTPDSLMKPGATEAEAGSAQEPPEDPTSFDPSKLEKKPEAQAKPAETTPRKTLWGGKKAAK